MNKVFITGASSGIGKSLALSYAKRKCTLGISARRIEMLNEISNACKELGATPFVYQLDVQDRNKCEIIAKQFIEDADGIDCVIANAGIGGNDNIYSGSSKDINNVLKTNILGVTNTLMPFIPYMKEQNNIDSIMTLSPLTPMATHYHIRNGAKLIKINPTTQNFEYKV